MSELFKGNTPLSTGIARIDDEHTRLHSESKRVAVLIAHSDDPDAVQAGVLSFTELLEAHFQYEETLFKRLLKERAIEHKNEHATLLLALRLFADTVKTREGSANWSDFINLEDVLLKHIILFDMDFKE